MVDHVKEIPPLRPYQIEDLAFYIKHKKCLNLSDPGTGKTPSVCVYDYSLWQGDDTKSIWCMPKSILVKNKDELIRFTPFEDEDIVIVDSPFINLSEPQRRGLRTPGTLRPATRRKLEGWKLLTSFGTITALGERALRDGRFSAFDNPTAKVFMMTFAMLNNGTEFEVKSVVGKNGGLVKRKIPTRFVWQDLEKLQPDINLCVVDEFHMGFSSHESGRTQAWTRYMRNIQHLVIMTGTLIKGTLASTYPAIHVVEPRYYPSYEAFFGQHVLYADDYGKPVSWRGQDKIKDILAKHSVQHTFEEVYGPESKVVIIETVQMGSKQRDSYQEFHDQALLELEDGWLDGSLPGVATIRSRQIMAHPETFDLAKGEVTGKDERLLVHLENAQRSGEALIVYAALQPEQERIYELVKKFGLTAGLINGNVSGAKRQRLSENFSNGVIQVMVASPPTASVGYNWGHVDHIIFVSMDYQDDNFLQAYRRAMRGARDKPLLITILQYAKSIDQRQYQIIEAKSVLANSVDPNRKVLKFSDMDATRV